MFLTVLLSSEEKTQLLQTHSLKQKKNQKEKPFSNKIIVFFICCKQKCNHLLVHLNNYL